MSMPHIVGADEHGARWSDGVRRTAHDVQAMLGLLPVPDRTVHRLDDTEPKEEPASRYKKPTARQLQILALVSLGYSNKQIGATLNLSQWTVQETLADVFRKLDANDRAHAVAICLRNGYME